MKLKHINAQELDKNIKATAHKSGKLGFTQEAASKLGLSINKSLLIAVNDEDPADRNLYAMIKEGVYDNMFKVNKAGEYFYINTKALFDSLRIDYEKESVVYDIVPDVINGEEWFKFKRRETKPGKKTDAATMTTA